VDSFEDQFRFYATVLGGEANNTAQSYDLSINGPIAGYDQIIRDIKALNVNITKLFAANIKLTDKITLLTLSTTKTRCKPRRLPSRNDAA
jgi:hypothetical protein